MTKEKMAWGEEEVEQHPSYGMVQFNRISSGGPRRLFGSSINTHAHSVRLRIYDNVKLYRGEHGDRVHNSNKPCIEVELSAAQYAELLTTMNVGMGVPCTVLYKEGKQVPDPPPLEVEAVRQRAVFGDRMKTAADDLKKHAIELRAYLEKSGIPKKHWGPLTTPVERMLDEVGVNSKFWLELFAEATEKIVTTAKAEVDAFTTSAIHNAGLKALADQAGVSAPALEAHKEAPRRGDALWNKLRNELRNAGDRRDSYECDRIEAEIERIYGSQS